MRIFVVCCVLLLLNVGVPSDALLIVRGGLGSGFSLVAPGANNCSASLAEAVRMRLGYPPYSIRRCSGVMDGIVALASIDALMPDHIVHVLSDPAQWKDVDEQRSACIIMRNDAEKCRNVRDPVTLWCEFNRYIHQVGKKSRHVVGHTQHFYTYEAQRVGKWKDPC